MGASYTERSGYGTDFRAAWNQAYDQAAYESGHEYSGDLGSKPGAVQVSVPKGLTARKFLGLALELCEMPSETELNEEERWIRSTEKSKVRAQSKTVWIRKARAERARFEKKYGKFMYDLERLAELIDDKWGYAAGLELTGTELKRAKEFHGIVGRRVKVFLFAGYCSS